MNSRARDLLRAKDLADSQYSEQITVADMAAAAGLSRAHFSRLFTATFAESPHQYLLTRRLERAAHLLRATGQPIADICFTVGLRSVGSFTTTFRRIYGRSPSAYRNRFPPEPSQLRIPRCIAQAYSRPQNRTFREDSTVIGP